MFVCRAIFVSAFLAPAIAFAQNPSTGRQAPPVTLYGAAGETIGSTAGSPDGVAGLDEAALMRLGCGPLSDIRNRIFMEHGGCHWPYTGAKAEPHASVNPNWVYAGQLFGFCGKAESAARRTLAYEKMQTVYNKIEIVKKVERLRNCIPAEDIIPDKKP